ncbi:caspase domain-containing protein [Chytridium lagenaria]|nr:caspase domain-containing protein [Chytridium lagenaria]
MHMEVDAKTPSQPVQHSVQILTPDETPTPSGRRPRHKALLIGIRYLNTNDPLAGPHNDVRNVHTWLTYTYPFHPNNILILTEDQPDPTKWLADDSISGINFLHYSGHGGAVLDDESGEILDDDMFKIAIAPLPEGCRLTAIFDCCHSGSILDLQYSYKPTGELEIQRNDARAPILEAVGRGIRKALVGHRAHAKAELQAAYKFYKTRNESQEGEYGFADGEVVKTADGMVVAADKALKARSTRRRSADFGTGADASQSIGIIPTSETVDLFAKTRKLVSDRYKQSVILSTGFPMDISRSLLCFIKI